MCDLYPITTNQKTIRVLFRVVNRYVDNLAPMLGLFPVTTLVANGQFHLTGKMPSGEAIEFKGLWTATDVREDGSWKIRMLSAFPIALPPKD